jgi:hydrogenase-4 component E
MEEYSKLISTVSLSLIITSYLVIELRNLRHSAYAYILQALLMCTLFVIFARQNPGLYYWALTAFVTKVVIIPYLLLRYIRRTTDQEFPPLIGYLGSILLVSSIILILYRVTHQYIEFLAPTPSATKEPFRTNLAVSLTIFILGLYCILSRRDAIKTVHGLLVLENGVHLSLVAFEGDGPYWNRYRCGCCGLSAPVHHLRGVRKIWFHRHVSIKRFTVVVDKGKEFSL